MAQNWLSAVRVPVPGVIEPGTDLKEEAEAVVLMPLMVIRALYTVIMPVVLALVEDISVSNPRFSRELVPVLVRFIVHPNTPPVPAFATPPEIPVCRLADVTDMENVIAVVSVALLP